MIREDYRYKELAESQKEKLAFEKEVAGRYLSGHPLAGREEDFKSFDFNLGMLAPVSDEEQEEGSENVAEYAVAHGTDVFLGGILSDVTIKFSAKSGKNWGFAILEDMYDSIEVLFFNRALEKYKKYLIDDKLVKIRGKIMLEDSAYPKIEVREVIPWELEEAPEDSDTRTLCMKFDLGDAECLNRVQDILKARKGSNPIKIQSNGKVYQLDYTTGGLDIIKEQLINIVGFRNLKILD